MAAGDDSLDERAAEAHAQELTAIDDEATASGAEQESGDKKSDETQTEKLIRESQSAQLFRTPDGTGYADIVINDHVETWPIRSKQFTHWLTHCYYTTHKEPPGREPIMKALALVEAKAQFDSPVMEVHVRVAHLGDTVYLDLGDEHWRVVEIDADGWEIVESAPVRFRRAAGMLSLPDPISGGSIEALKSFLNVKDDHHFVLVVSFLLAALHGKGPYPVAVLTGEHGSAKSNFARILRALLDPNMASLRALPREDRDLFIAATNAHLLSFDNVSRIPHWLSDTLCRLATGAGFATRKLYSDGEEAIFNESRPIVLNGIEDMVDRPDLADRSLFFTLEPIPDDERRSEDELWSAFDDELPLILGALLDGVVKGLAQIENTHLSELPRMADFARWATACETAYWESGTFMSGYTGNQEEALEAIIESDPVASELRRFIRETKQWKGTATQLLSALDARVSDGTKRSSAWPKTAKSLSGRIRRATPNLRKVGVVITHGREGRARTRTIEISLAAAKDGNLASASSAPSAEADISRDDGVLHGNSLRTVESGADASSDQELGATVRGNAPPAGPADDTDGADEESATSEGGWTATV